MIRGFAGDTRGVAMIEFVFVLPVALLLYVGSVQLQDGISCNRKVTSATRAIADLVSQSTSGVTSASDVDNSLAAATQVLAPYAARNATMRITEVATDLQMRTTVQWSRAQNGSAYTRGSVATLPLAMRIPGTYFLYAEVSYAYRPAARFGITGPMTLRDNLYMLPRNSNKIDCADC